MSDATSKTSGNQESGFMQSAVEETNEIHVSPQKATYCGLILAICVIVIAVVSGLIGFSIGQSTSNSSSNGEQEISSCGSNNSNINLTYSDSNCSGFSYPEYDYNSDSFDASLYGQWETLVPNNTDGTPSYGLNLGIQVIHAVLLPSGKVLMISGSSNRNTGKNAQFYPYYEKPNSGEGVYNWYYWETITNINNITRYYQSINNNGIYDIDSNTFNRIPHPIPPIQNISDGYFELNDLFCSDHIHTRDGNVFFNGGTEYYYPWFSGAKTMYLFNWTKEVLADWNYYDWTQMPDINISVSGSSDDEYYPWIFIGNMEAGRWYPRSVPLLDGRIVIFSGTYDWDNIKYNTQANPYVGFFDYDEWIDSGKKQNVGYVSVNSKSYAQINSPFRTRLLDELLIDDINSTCWNSILESKYYNTCIEEIVNDSFPLYPQNYLMPDERIFLPTNGASYWISQGGQVRKGLYSYFMTINGNKTNPTISWERGPDHKTQIAWYGTSVIDPNSYDVSNQSEWSLRINTYAGLTMDTLGVYLPGTISVEDDTIEWYNYRYKTQWVGWRGTRRLEVFEINNNNNNDNNGNWTDLDEDYLGENLFFDRNMHFSVLLPSKEILIVGGGNYEYSDSVRSPLLLTPVYDENGVFMNEYCKTFMASQRRPRYYHNIALLLTDGRVLSGGGNAARAVLNWEEPISYENGTNTTLHGRQPKPNLERVNRFIYQLFGPMAEGYSDSEAEIYEMEVFSPPYMFIDPGRTAVIQSMQWIDIDSDVVGNATLQGKVYYLLHSNASYQLTVTNLPDQSLCSLNDSSIVLIKLGSSTHGWDSGQILFRLEFDVISDSVIEFVMPKQRDLMIVPAYYMLFFVDCRGKPAKSIMTRYDNQANSPF